MPDTSPLKDFLKTSLPAVIDLSSQTVVWTIQAILIGKISAAAFGGVGMAIQILILFFAILLTFIIGSTVIINRHLGAGQRWEANHILGQALMIGILISVVTAVFWYFGATFLFKIIKENEPVAQTAGIEYLRIMSFFAPLILTNFLALGIIRGVGDTRIAMGVNMLINILSLFLAPVMIFGLFGFPRMEVRGAALAIGISHSLGLLTTVYVLRGRRSVLFLSFRELTTPNFESFKRLFKTGFPTTVEQVAWAFGQMVVTSYAAVLGIAVLAAHQVFLRIQGILSMFYLGFGLGAMTLVGKNLGAERHSQAERMGKTAGNVMLLVVFGVATLMVVFSKPIIALFTSEPRVVGLGSSVMLVFALVQIPKALQAVLTGNLRGAGDLKWIMWLTILGVVFFQMGGGWVAAFILNLSLLGLWLIHGIDETLRLGLNYWRFKGGKWKFIHI